MVDYLCHSWAVAAIVVQSYTSWNVVFYHTSAGVNLWFFLKCMVFTSSSDVIGVFTVDSLDWTWNFIWKQKQNKKEIRLQPHVVLLCNDVEDFAKGKYVAFSVVTSDLLYEMHRVVAAVDVCLKCTFDVCTVNRPSSTEDLGYSDSDVMLLFWPISYVCILLYF